MGDLCKLSHCIPYTYDESYKQYNCVEYKPESCYGIKETDVPFYNSINWERLTSMGNQVMNDFMVQLNAMYQANHENFQNVVKTVYPNIVARGASPNYLFIKVENLVKDQNRKCNDFNFAFRIECQTDAGNVNDKATHTIRLFHIAIHPEKPKYFQIEKADQAITRSMFTCGFFPKKEGDLESESGSFHYKIDNYVLPIKVNSANCNKKLEENSCPFKPFVPSTTTAGMFELIDDMLFQNVSFPNEFNIELQQHFVILHSFIYNKFIQFWNTFVFPQVRKIPGGKSRKLKITSVSKTNKYRKIKSKRYQSKNSKGRTFKRTSIKK